MTDRYDVRLTDTQGGVSYICNGTFYFNYQQALDTAKDFAAHMHAHYLSRVEVVKIFCEVVDTFDDSQT